MSRPDEGLIHAWLDGELDAADAARVEALVCDDPEWAAAAAEARGLIAASERILSSLDTAPGGVIPDTSTANRAADQSRTGSMAGSGRMASTAPGRRRTMPWWMARAAAVIVVVTGVTFVLARDPAPTSVDSLATVEAEQPARTRADSVAPPAAAVASTPVPLPASGAPATTSTPVRDRATPASAPAAAPAAAQAPTSPQVAGAVADERRLASQALAPAELKRADVAGAGAAAAEQVVATSVRARGAPELVAAKVADEPAAIECYRQPTRQDAAAVYRVRRLSDSTAVMVVLEERREAERTNARGAVRESATLAAALRVHLDTLWVSTATGSQIALRVTCPSR